MFSIYTEACELHIYLKGTALLTKCHHLPDRMGQMPSCAVSESLLAPKTNQLTDLVSG